MSAFDLLWKVEEEEEEEERSNASLLKRRDLNQLTSYISFVFVSSFSCCRSVSVVLCVVEKKEGEEEGKQVRGGGKGLENTGGKSNPYWAITQKPCWEQTPPSPTLSECSMVPAFISSSLNCSTSLAFSTSTFLCCSMDTCSCWSSLTSSLRARWTDFSSSAACFRLEREIGRKGRKGRKEGEEGRGRRKGRKKRVRKAHYMNSMARRQTRQSSHEKINLLMCKM